MLSIQVFLRKIINEILMIKGMLKIVKNKISNFQTIRNILLNIITILIGVHING